MICLYDRSRTRPPLIQPESLEVSDLVAVQYCWSSIEEKPSLYPLDPAYSHGTTPARWHPRTLLHPGSHSSPGP